jgi:protein-L-isoaspartate(D-aspartate) O-methyltransferase
MVETSIAARGMRSQRVLNAMRAAHARRFSRDHLHEFAYEDAPLPISAGQTISQPYIVALMVEALLLEGGERVLEIGAGSGYAAAVLAEIAAEVYTVERIGQLAEKAAAVLADLGYANVHVLHGDGARGWPEHAPYDAIIVAAGGPKVPDSLKAQLKVGGRLMIPIGPDPRTQELGACHANPDHEYRPEDLADVRFVPLLGEEAWPEPDKSTPSRRSRAAGVVSEDELAGEIAAAAEPFDTIAAADLQPLMERIGDSRVVLLNEATHGTSEFYRMRDRISRELIVKKGFSFVAIEGDWPDAARVDHYVRHLEFPASEWTAFAGFPVWMWRNNEVRDFIDWLREHNAGAKLRERMAFLSLDLYSLYDSIRSVLKYLDEVDPETAKLARERYGCLTPWQTDPTTYGHAALTGRYPTCEKPVVQMLRDLLTSRGRYAEHDGERFMDAVQNARLVANAERYYRIMYYGSRASWNLRDEHMFETLKTLLAFYGPRSKAIAWAHNPHVGDAAATELSSRASPMSDICAGVNLASRSIRSGSVPTGERSRRRRIGVAPMEVKTVRPALK